MRKLKSCIIGCGKIADVHAKVLKSLDECELAGVYSRDINKSKKFVEKHGVGTGYDDIDRMIDETNCDIAVICTPHPNHCEPVIKCLSRKVNVITEKPMSVTVDDADKMIHTAEKYGVSLGVISQRRWYPSSMRIKHAIDNGKIGKPVLASINMYSWRDEAYYKSDPWRGFWDKEGGGVLINQASHQLDLLLWFMGDIDEVFGYWTNANHPYIEVEDTVVAVVKFTSGALGQITVSTSQNPALSTKVMVHGSNGATVSVLTEIDAAPFKTDDKVPVVITPYNDIWTIPEDQGAYSQWLLDDKKLIQSIGDQAPYFIGLQMREFIDSIKSHRAPLVSGIDGRNVVRLIDAIYKSANEKRPVSLC